MSPGKRGTCRGRVDHPLQTRRDAPSHACSSSGSRRGKGASACSAGFAEAVATDDHTQYDAVD